MPPVDLTDAEHDELARFLREAIAADRFPLSPRVRLGAGAVAPTEAERAAKRDVDEKRRR